MLVLFINNLSSLVGQFVFVNFVWIVRVTSLTLTSLTLTSLPALLCIMPTGTSSEAGGEKLSRQHGVKLSPAAQVSVEECCLAIWEKFCRLQAQQEG